MKPVTLAAFNGREEAEPLRQYLGAAGIRAEIRSDGDPGPVEFERPSAGVRLEVAREDFEEALRLVYEWNVAGSALSGLSEGAPSWMRSKRGTAGGGAKAPAGG